MSVSPALDAEIYRSMLQTGLVHYGEALVDEPLMDVWDALQNYFRWTPAHAEGRRKTIKGEAGKVGEVVEIWKAGAASPVFSETVRIRPPQLRAGAVRMGNIVYRVFDEAATFGRFSDFGVMELGAKTLVYRSVYGEMAPASEEFVTARRELDEGRESLSGTMPPFVEQMAGYIRKQRQA